MSLLANHGVIGQQKTPPTLVEADFSVTTGLTTTQVFASTPNDGELLVFIYRTITGAPSTLPGGLTLLTSIDNNSLGLYVYTKVAASETNSYQFGDASSNEKSVIGIRISNYANGAVVALSADSGAGNVASVNMPSSGTHTYAAGTLIIAPLVLTDNRSIARTPFDSAIGAVNGGAPGTFRTYAAFRSLTTNSSHQIQFTLNAGTRAKALSITVT